MTLVFEICVSNTCSSKKWSKKTGEGLILFHSQAETHVNPNSNMDADNSEGQVNYNVILTLPPSHQVHVQNCPATDDRLNHCEEPHQFSNISIVQGLYLYHVMIHGINCTAVSGIMWLFWQQRLLLFLFLLLLTASLETSAGQNLSQQLLGGRGAGGAGHRLHTERVRHHQDHVQEVKMWSWMTGRGWGMWSGWWEKSDEI